MKYKEFIGSVHYSAEDEVFYGKLKGIDDLIMFEGESVKALNSAFMEAVEDYLELCKKAGKQGGKSYKGSFNVRIDPEMHKKAARKSIELGLSLNQLVICARSVFPDFVRSAGHFVFKKPDLSARSNAWTGIAR